MKIKRTITRKRDGMRITTIEHAHDEVVQVIRDSSYYSLGYPVDDVVRGDNISGAMEVTWDVLEQRWRHD
jgi:hypothetical protein